MKAVVVLSLVALLVICTGAAAGGRKQASPAAATEPRFRVTLTGDDSTPRAGEPWHFVVRAADTAGHPVGGTAIVRVLVGGRIVDTVGWFGFNGLLRRAYRWPATLGGGAALLQATVVGPGGRRTVGYAVRVIAETGHPLFRAALRGDNHTPSAGTAWHFVVRAADASGRPAGGTAVIRVVVGTRVVDTVGWFGFTGELKRTYRWSPKLRGRSALLQAKVVGSGGTRTVGYAVRVL